MLLISKGPHVLIYSAQLGTDIPACPQHRFSGAVQKSRDGNEWKKPSHHLRFDPSPISVTQLLAFGIVSAPSGTDCFIVMWNSVCNTAENDQVHM